ncbi:ABC transporter ATP-binding protein [Evansella sp. AB-rgal1]|uniref:ABC transporter ATP-binding protein n=1 Tax=Evansella sp. AB-rgal1 TaxID=3242696 RepID=UPI00359D28C1
MDIIMKIEGVTKTFKKNKAVDGVSFNIKQGEVIAILGPNGAGKTTTIMMMLGLLNTTSGQIKVFGLEPKSKEVRERVGAMLQDVSVVDALTVKEVIKLFRSYYPNPMSFQELVALTGLNEEDLKKKSEKLSGGQKRRLSFALALAGDPDLLFFDEPTVGMDITSRNLFWKTMNELKARGKTIIFTTHYLQEADDTAERIILFHQGKIVEDGTPAYIKAKLAKKYVSFTYNKPFIREELTSLPYVTNVSERDGRIFLESENTDEVLRALFEKRYAISQIEVVQGRLEEAFEQLTEKKEVV